MTTANKHMTRSHRSHQTTKAMLGTIENRNHISRASKQISQTKFQKILTSMATRLSKMSERLSARFSKRQDR